MAAGSALDRVLGCLLGGALGDALGGIGERGRPGLSDDTQLTLATCETIVAAGGADPAHLADTFRRWFEGRRLSGLGSSTLKALRDLSAGAHWAVSGAQGEMAAGNGGAMRIAPLAFVPADRVTIRDCVRITHHSDEAYIGALAVLEAMRRDWPSGQPDLLQDVAGQLPDSRVRDRLLDVAEVTRHDGLEAVAEAFGASGYVVDTVPLALAAAWELTQKPFASTLDELVRIGGDTDTIASIAGQVAGARVGTALLPHDLLALLPERELIEGIARRFAARIDTTIPG